MLIDDLRFLIRGAFNRRESIANRGRQLLARTLYRAFGKGLRVFANSIPKSGTHLLLRGLDLMPGLVRSGYFVSYVHHSGRLQDVQTRQHDLQGVGRGCFVGAHMPFTVENGRLLAEMEYKHVLIIRDPRDIMVSHFHHIMKRPTNRLHNYMMALPDNETRLLALIEGISQGSAGVVVGQPGIGEEFRQYLAWKEHGAHVVRFEDLIGEAGGGSAERQLMALADLSVFLELSLDTAVLQTIGENLYYQKANTFRKGAVEDWRNYLSPAHCQVLQRKLGPLLIASGYESDDDWVASQNVNRNRKTHEHHKT